MRFLALDMNVWGYYNKLVVFIPNAKDVWDFCLGGFKSGFFWVRGMFLAFDRFTKRALKRLKQNNSF
ncbi:hypothetical protein E5Q02_04510 [Helicobacter pylori]|nr:hypothetical protein E5Q02_04510 [Helicobacter pylori]